MVEVDPKLEEEFKEETGKNAIWRGKPTAAFQKWLKKRGMEPIPEPEKEVQEIVEIGEAEGEEEEEYDEESTQEEIEALQADKWWLQDKWRSLLDPELASKIDLTNYDISKLIEEFTDKMIEEDFVDFRITGMAIFSSSKLYHKKITEVIDDEEKIERDRKIAKLRREVPKSISQPLRQTQKIATSDELFSAMRRAIIETMQRREKLKVRRIKRADSQVIKKKKKGKGKLTAELLKHITGSDETIETQLRRWHNIAIQKGDSIKSTLTMDDIKRDIYNEKLELIQKKAKYIQGFQAMLHLMALNKIKMSQYDTESPIEIKIRDRSKVKFD